MVFFISADITGTCGGTVIDCIPVLYSYLIIMFVFTH